MPRNLPQFFPFYAMLLEPSNGGSAKRVKTGFPIFRIMYPQLIKQSGKLNRECTIIQISTALYNRN